MDCSEALNSSEWLKISSESVQKFLQFECFNAFEIELLRALIKWGKFQLQQDGADLEDNQKLRSKILPGLQQIRFDNITQKEFAELCLEELGAVLTGDEKSSIFMYFSIGKWEPFSTDISPSKLAPRCGPYSIFKFQYIKDTDYGNWRNMQHLEFVIDSKAVFAGLTLYGHEACHNRDFSFKLLDSGNKVMGEGNSHRVLKNRVADDFCNIIPQCTLAANTKYKLSIDGLHTGRLYCRQADYTIHIVNSVCDGLTLTIINKSLCADVEKLVFKKIQK